MARWIHTIQERCEYLSASFARPADQQHHGHYADQVHDRVKVSGHPFQDGDYDDCRRQQDDTGRSCFACHSVVQDRDSSSTATQHRCKPEFAHDLRDAQGGSLLLAVPCRVSAWGWVGFLLSKLAWIVYAIITATSRLLAQNLGFTVASVIGIYRHRADLRATAGAVAQMARRNFSLPIR
jgi:hypothetical protein